jgi:acetyl-CoA C-acetyltransferase
VVSLVLALRHSGQHGLLFANGGFATHNHSIILSRAPRAAFPRAFHFQDEAEQKRGPLPPLDEAYTGPGVIETYTVLYQRDGSPRFGVVVARNPAGARFLAKIPATDADGIAMLTSGAVEPVGRPGTAAPGPDNDLIWKDGT